MNTRRTWNALGVVVAINSDGRRSRLNAHFDLAIYAPHSTQKPVATITLACGNDDITPKIGERFVVAIKREDQA